MTAGGKNLLTLREAAARLRLNVSCLRAWKAKRKIAVVHLGRAVRVTPDEIARLVREGTVPARSVRQDEEGPHEPCL